MMPDGVSSGVPLVEALSALLDGVPAREEGR